MPVIAGAGSNTTAEAIDLARTPRRPAPTRVLVVTPYYNKPTQEGLYQHFKAVNDAVGIPIFIYNIPPRSVDRHVGRDHGAALRAQEHRRREGRDRQHRPRVSLQRQAMGPDFIQLSGEDATALGFMAHGGHGCISVTSNVAPRLCAELQEACLAGDYAGALKVQDRLMPLHDGDLRRDRTRRRRKYASSLLGRMARRGPPADGPGHRADARLRSARPWSMPA